MLSKKLQGIYEGNLQNFQQTIDSCTIKIQYFLTTLIAFTDNMLVGIIKTCVQYVLSKTPLKFNYFNQFEHLLHLFFGEYYRSTLLIYFSFFEPFLINFQGDESERIRDLGEQMKNLYSIIEQIGKSVLVDAEEGKWVHYITPFSQLNHTLFTPCSHLVHTLFSIPRIFLFVFNFNKFLKLF